MVQCIWNPKTLHCHLMIMEWLPTSVWSPGSCRRISGLVGKLLQTEEKMTMWITEKSKSAVSNQKTLQRVKYLHLSPLRLDVRRLCNTRQPFVALVQLWGSHRLPSAYMEITYVPLIKQQFDQRNHQGAAGLWEPWCRPLAAGGGGILSGSSFSFTVSRMSASTDLDSFFLCGWLELP